VVAVSHAAIAAVLARDELTAGERQVAWSLASFANREQLAWPGIAAAAARAGLGRSRYLHAREQLVRRGLLDVETRGVGRGQSSAVRLLFAQSGPWWVGEVNAELLEAVLGYSRARGPARLLLATLAALSDAQGVVEELMTEELCRAAGLANSTYRRARATLLASGEVRVDGDAGGRGRTCRWTVRRPAELGKAPTSGPKRRTTPRPGVRPLIAAARADATAELEKGPALSGVSVGKGPNPSGVSGRKGPVLSGVPGPNPAKTPPETPPPNARAGRVPVNPRTGNPPNPPEGGSFGTEVFIEETYRTDRGRLRRRRVAIDVEATCSGFSMPTLADAIDWKRIRELMAARLGESQFEIWLSPLELRVVDASRALVVDVPDATRSWVRERFGRVIAGAGAEVGRVVLVADEARSRAMRAAGFDRVGVAIASPEQLAGSSACKSYGASTCSLSYTSAYNQVKEVG
jgi:hypothetical protein